MSGPLIQSALAFYDLSKKQMEEAKNFTFPPYSVVISKTGNFEEHGIVMHSHGTDPDKINLMLQYQSIVQRSVREMEAVAEADIPGWAMKFVVELKADEARCKAANAKEGA